MQVARLKALDVKKIAEIAGEDVALDKAKKHQDQDTEGGGTDDVDDVDSEDDGADDTEDDDEVGDIDSRDDDDNEVRFRVQTGFLLSGLNRQQLQLFGDGDHL